ncbi:MAG: hypothetical protein PHX18_05670 [Candidatus Gastranaerophilales bacterium]|nr:hypothetical protein [Candidatus Gastranaerophilales bacterium]
MFLSAILIIVTMAVFASSALCNDLRNNLKNVWLEQSPDKTVNIVLEIDKNFASNPNLVKKDDRTYLLIMPSTDTAIIRNIDVRGFEKYVSSVQVDYVKYNSAKENGYAKVTIKAEPNVHFRVKSQLEKNKVTKYSFIGIAFSALLGLFIFLGLRNFVKKPNKDEGSAYAAITEGAEPGADEEDRQDGSIEAEDGSEEDETESLENEPVFEEKVDEIETTEVNEDILDEEVPEEVLDLFEEGSDEKGWQDGSIEAEDSLEEDEIESLENEPVFEEKVDEIETTEVNEDILDEEVPEEILDLFEENIDDAEITQIEEIPPMLDENVSFVEEGQFTANEDTDNIFEDIAEDIGSDEEGWESIDLEEEQLSVGEENLMDEESIEEGLESEELSANEENWQDESIEAQDALEADEIEDLENEPVLEENIDEVETTEANEDILDEASEDDLEDLFNVVVEENFNSPFTTYCVPIEGFIGNSPEEISSDEEISELDVEITEQLTTQDFETDSFVEEVNLEDEQLVSDEEDLQDEVIEVEDGAEDSEIESPESAPVLEEKQESEPEEAAVDIESFFKTEPDEEESIDELFVNKPQENTIELESEPEIKEIEIDDSEPVVLLQKEIDKDKMLYLIRHEGVFSLIGVMEDNVFVLHRFEQPVKTNEISLKLNEHKANQNIYIVKIDTWRALIGVNTSAIELILEL